MSAITTHVLDLSTGMPAEGLTVTLERRDAGGGWATLTRRHTDEDGRVRDLLAAGALSAGVWRLTFATGEYFGSRGVPTFLPEVAVTFEVFDAERHHHVPLLLSPFGFSSYRGS